MKDMLSNEGSDGTVTASEAAPVAEGSTPTAATPLLEILFPTLGLCTEETLYFRLSGGASYSYARGEITLSRGGAVDLGTYFNGLGVRKWRTLTSVSRVSVELDVEGSFEVRFILHRLGRSELVLDEVSLDSPERGRRAIDLPFWSAHDDGILAVRLTARGEGTFHGGAFVTPDLPLREVRLGIVVTTFNRQDYVLPAIERLRGSLPTAGAPDARYRLVVVDNGRNLPIESGAGVTVIPNRNLGGAGGFMRGLAHLLDGGWATHCLFMDDDATCEVDAIRRAHAVLSFARDPDVPVAGAMLFEDRQAIQYERGAVYRGGGVRPVGNEMDLREMGNLLANEVEERIDYAPWWFCAFALARAERMAFPFFVRGDDILFSMDNLPAPIVMNGICSWQEDFENKQGPMIEYLWTRALLVICLLRGDAASMKRLVGAFRRHAFFLGSKYNYDRMEAVCMAFEDVLAGPGFWRDNADMATRRKDILAMCREERSDLALDASGLAQYDNKPRMSLPDGFRFKLKAFLGHLVPDRLLKPDTEVRGCVKDSGVHDVAFRRSSYVQYVASPRQGFRLTRDRRRFLGLVRRAGRAGSSLLGERARLSDAYAEGHAEMTTRAFWAEQFSK